MAAKTYRKTALVTAEQFLPAIGQIPKGVYSDGHGDPRKRLDCRWVLDTKEGRHDVRGGDYICTGPAGEQWNVAAEIFEATYEEVPAALSAQVQDVAGWQSMDSAPTDGSEFVAGRRYAPDGEFVVHTYKWVGEPNYWSSKRNGVCIRPQYQDDFVWCPLPASPASKHGDAE